MKRLFRARSKARCAILPQMTHDVKEIIIMVLSPCENLIKTAVYAADVSPLEESSIYDAAYGTVSAERRKKTDRYIQMKDRRLSLGAELLLRYGLRAAGIYERTFEIVSGPYGKPYLKNGDIYFSISHSGEYAVCAVSGCEVGCDIEKTAPTDLKIAGRYFSESEYDDIAAQPTPEAQSDMFFRYWTLRESFLKAAGFGMKLPLSSFKIVRGDEISVVQSADDRTYRFKEFGDIPGYRCAVCTAGECKDAVFHIVDIKDAVMSSF